MDSLPSIVFDGRMGRSRWIVFSVRMGRSTSVVFDKRVSGSSIDVFNVRVGRLASERGWSANVFSISCIKYIIHYIYRSPSFTQFSHWYNISGLRTSLLAWEGNYK